MTHLRKANLFAAILLAFLFGSGDLSVPEVSALTVAEAGKRKINLSGRQRMLSQRMAKAACFIAIDVNKAGHVKMAAEAHALFDKTLKGLRQGDQEQGLSSEKNPNILRELAGVEALWSDYGPAIDQVVKQGAVAGGILGQVAALNVPTLRQMHKTVGEFERHYGASGQIHPALALALNVSGRQRMLSQKASKEFCLIAAGHEVEANRQALSETVTLFERSLLALMDGDDVLGLPEAPTDELYEQLEKVQGIWEPLRDIFKAVANGATPSATQIQRVAADNNPLLVEMNRAVWMYDEL
jgi:hypothetical protein